MHWAGRGSALFAKCLSDIVTGIAGCWLSQKASLTGIGLWCVVYFVNGVRMVSVRGVWSKQTNWFKQRSSFHLRSLAADFLMTDSIALDADGVHLGGKPCSYSTFKLWMEHPFYVRMWDHTFLIQFRDQTLRFTPFKFIHPAQWPCGWEMNFFVSVSPVLGRYSSRFHMAVVMCQTLKS